MFDLLAAGHEEDNLGDYLKNKRHLAQRTDLDVNPALREIENEENLKYRIRKSESMFVSEAKDNF